MERQLPLTLINYSSVFFLFLSVTIGILGSTTEAQAQFKLVPKFVKKKTPLEIFLVRKVGNFVVIV